MPPPPTLKPFSGTGRTLGATAPPAAAAGDAPAMPAPGSVAGVWRSLVSSELWLSLSTMVGVLVSLLWNLVTFRRGSEASAAEAYELVLDPDQPATVLKLQLADDSRHEVRQSRSLDTQEDKRGIEEKKREKQGKRREENRGERKQHERRHGGSGGKGGEKGWEITGRKKR